MKKEENFVSLFLINGNKILTTKKLNLLPLNGKTNSKQRKKKGIFCQSFSDKRKQNQNFEEKETQSCPTTNLKKDTKGKVCLSLKF